MKIQDSASVMLYAPKTPNTNPAAMTFVAAAAVIVVKAAPVPKTAPVVSAYPTKKKHQMQVLLTQSPRQTPAPAVAVAKTAVLIMA